jgi:hypothetical protein
VDKIQVPEGILDIPDIHLQQQIGILQDLVDRHQGEQDLQRAMLDIHLEQEGLLVGSFLEQVALVMGKHQQVHKDCDTHAGCHTDMPSSFFSVTDEMVCFKCIYLSQ